MEGPFTVKAICGEEQRWFLWPTGGCFRELRSSITSLYALSPVNGEVRLHYIDDEGDVVGITSDDELREAFRQSVEVAEATVESCRATSESISKSSKEISMQIAQLSREDLLQFAEAELSKESLQQSEEEEEEASWREQKKQTVKKLCEECSENAKRTREDSLRSSSEIRTLVMQV
ncbi:hypothetical protein QOT17_009973 [Balamuthia mandrillaris]